MRTLISLLGCLILVSCNSQKQPAGNESKDPNVRVVQEFHPNGRLKSSTEAIGNLRHGVSKTYRSDGTLENEIHYVRNRKDGIARNYYPDGFTIKNEIPYVDGFKHGSSKWFYQNGQMYRETPYVNNKISGTRRYWYESGVLMAELPYKDSQPGLGLKEYNQEGELKDQKVRIEVREDDRTSMDNYFILELRLSDGNKDVEFFTGELTDGIYLNEQLGRVLTENGTGMVRIHIPRGSFRMETLNLLAVAKTRLGHTLILQRAYHLAVENKV